MLLFSNSALLMKDVIYNRMFRQLLIERRQEIEERTLASSERGLGLLYESEKVRGKLRKKGEIAFVFLLCNWNKLCEHLGGGRNSRRIVKTERAAYENWAGNNTIMFTIQSFRSDLTTWMPISSSFCRGSMISTQPWGIVRNTSRWATFYIFLILSNFNIHKMTYCHNRCFFRAFAVCLELLETTLGVNYHTFVCFILIGCTEAFVYTSQCNQLYFLPQELKQFVIQAGLLPLHLQQLLVRWNLTYNKGKSIHKEMDITVVLTISVQMNLSNGLSIRSARVPVVSSASTLQQQQQSQR